MPGVVEAEGIHFAEGLLRGPMIEGDAIGGDENASAIMAEAAMDENGFARRLPQQGKKLRDLRGRGIGEATNGDGHKTHAEGFGACAFLFARARRFAAQINDRSDPEFFEFGEIGKIWLRAAKKLIGNFS